MKRLFLISALLLGFWAGKPAGPEPKVNTFVLVDGQPLGPAGVPTSFKELRVEGMLDKASKEAFPGLVGQPVLVRGTVSLARGTRRVGSIPFSTGDLPIFKNGIGKAEPGDRVIVEVLETGLQQKDGTVLKLTQRGSNFHQFGLY
jgi:hypothetical protein